ncbi:hypothetical protein O1611_g7609 [Lasiodiplodia mahajangana]|uniref:Uncharacterized protein n=1 Tax=Lasiodiplodia mahajangana TaxID=1108764 RepID=A0ACC2JFE3_9PEZI|nr:hypothetical protein O1611_g7609 [Lasiodiplodia mahajangana]
MNSSGFTYKSHGTNGQGNHYCARDYGLEAPNQNAYHYSNTDNSYFYSNPDGSRYFNDGCGHETYTTPGGVKYTASYGSAWVREQN